jgi:hypothetical protein
MPSLCSHVFRVRVKSVSAQMDSIASIPELRAFVGAGSNRPVLPCGTRVRPITAEKFQLGEFSRLKLRFAPSCSTSRGKEIG